MPSVGTDTQPGYLVASPYGTFYVIRGEEAKQISRETYDFARIVADFPPEVVAALLAATHAAPPFTDSYQVRYDAAAAVLGYKDAQLLHEEAHYCAECGALLAIGVANIKADQAKEGQS